MTRENAVEILENGEWWDNLDEWYEAANPEYEKLHDAVDMAIAALRAQQEAEKNEPLTLDELREMDGEPVYDGLGYEWYIIGDVTDDEVIMTDGLCFDISGDSANTAVGRFYRHKPKEGTK